MVATSQPRTPGGLLGPFLGHVTATSVKVWLHLEGERQSIFVAVHSGSPEGPSSKTFVLSIDPNRLWTGVVTLTDLAPGTQYFYSLWEDEACTQRLELDGLAPVELRFRTLPAGEAEQIDFLVMSCHNPTKAKDDGRDGYAVWADIPQILDESNNRAVRMALLIGDQVYADDWQTKLLAERDSEARLRLYLEVYRAFWADINYRRVLCCTPSVMIWDDHDIADGWGSEESSFIGDTAAFKDEWKDLFESASEAFAAMQSARNPAGLSDRRSDGFDFCFTVGTLGFVMMDLRTHRNAREKRVMDDAQWHRIRNWIDSRRGELAALFVVSPVVFSHGSPVIEDLFESSWEWVLKGVDMVARKSTWGKSLQLKFNDTLGDVRDDIRDSWAWPGNAARADEVLDYLFQVQNDPSRPVSVVLLSGDIHTSGYATIYSNAPTHQERSSIPHITSSAVAYAPFNWLLEALYRNATKSVPLGATGRFSSQVSHHFCSRGVAVLSIRPIAGSPRDLQLKVKYYLEGHPEPRVLLFDLRGASHRESITWAAQREVSDAKYASAEHRSAAQEFDAQVEGKLESALHAEFDRRAKEHVPVLNWRDSVVDLMKVLQMDSSQGNRLRLAREWGYSGPLDDHFFQMNVWLKARIFERLKTAARPTMR